MKRKVYIYPYTVYSMEVKKNKNNNQKTVTIPFNNPLKEGDRVKVVKVEPLTEEQFINKLKTDTRLKELHMFNEEHAKSVFNDIKWNFVEVMKKRLNINSIDSDEGYETFQCTDFEVEYQWGEGFNDDFEGVFIPFCNNGLGGFADSYFNQMLDDSKTLDKMVQNTKEIGNLKIYTDLVESYHKDRFHRYVCKMGTILKGHDRSMNGEFEMYINFEDYNINIIENMVIVSQDGHKKHLTMVFD